MRIQGFFQAECKLESIVFYAAWVLRKQDFYALGWRWKHQIDVAVSNIFHSRAWAKFGCLNLSCNRAVGIVTCHQEQAFLSWTEVKYVGYVWPKLIDA